jgi:hypothetical protein
VMGWEMGRERKGRRWRGVWGLMGGMFELGYAVSQ